MFSNVIYFLIALFIYTTAELFETVETIHHPAILNSLLASLVFIFFCRFFFWRLEQKILRRPSGYYDHTVNLYIARFSAIALMIFAWVIYGFKLDLIFSNIEMFNIFPTFEAVLFLSFFLCHLMIVWNEAYRVQKRYLPKTITKKNYILSNIFFSLPALLPWFCLSITTDILSWLPFQGLKNFLQTPAGEIGYIGLFLIAVAVFGPVLIRRMWQCRPIENGTRRSHIEAVCKQAGLQYADILTWKLFGGTMITAGVMGLISKFRYILVTPALLNSLTEDEIKSVILHEIGHVQKHHMVFYLFFFAGFIGCNFVFFEPLMLLLYVYEPFYWVFDAAGIQRNAAHAIRVSTTVIIFFIFYFRFIFGFFMRNFERQADLHIFEFLKDASPLISTLYRIASSARQSLNKPNWHHFSIKERIGYLKKCQRAPCQIRVHHSRVKKYVFGYFIGISVVIYAGYAINYGSFQENFSNFITEKMLLQQMALEPENSDLYVLVGDYYYHKKEYEKAIHSYETVLRADDTHVHALNNIAWLFATCPENEFRNHEKALFYAKKALDQKKEAYILDTYAEALFLNNDVETAVAMAREALKAAKKKKDYYKRQVKRFEEKRLKESLNTNG